MSTRYVWNVCDVIFPSPEYTLVSEIGPFANSSIQFTATNQYKPRFLDDGSIFVTYTDDSNHVEVEINRPIPCAQYPYCFGYRNQVAYAATGYWFKDSYSQGYTHYVSLKHNDSTPNNPNSFYCGSITAEKCSAGAVQSSISNRSGSYKPTNGMDGMYWYKYLGSDSIDPAAITVKGEPRAGETVAISVTPGSGKVYGGTVSYIYQYCVNGGTWTDIETATATSVTCTVPANAKTIQFRAQAKDDMGFTSADYVTTETTAIERLNLWVGAGGKARKGTELYVGVGGKARKAVSAYVGVNGKARRFL